LKIEVQVDEKIEETKLVIYTKQVNDEITELVEKLSSKNEVIKAFLGDEMYFIKEDDIESVFSENGKVYIKTVNNNYQVKKRVYELEESLPKNKFIRISNSEIVNFDKVENLNNKIIGSIRINLKSGYSTYVSRRYINKIKDFLDM
jgi:DNA-binding LytR/AlgR family response regulator